MCCHDMDRRTFLGVTTAFAAGSLAVSGATPAVATWARDFWDPGRPYQSVGEPITVQPLLMYRIPQKRQEASWKSWGGIQSLEAVDEEKGRIARELKQLAERAGFPVRVLPVAAVASREEAHRAKESGADAVLVYPATGSGELLRACFSAAANAIIFVRHRSGPVYYWYEALSTRYLQKTAQSAAPYDSAAGPSVGDVVVDDYADLLWRLRALYAGRNLLGARIVALGGAQGKYAANAPEQARQRFKMEIVDCSYDDLAARIARAKGQPASVELAQKWTRSYLSLPQTRMQTEPKFVANAFLLYGIFKDLMRENGASMFTINSCMGTILPMAQTTACLTLSLLNDEGLLAFCESDFVILPPGILLHYVCGKPVFLHNSTFPHKGIVTCAHCTSPRRMDGVRYEPASIMTHYESEYGAAPKVDMPVGQTVTFVDPEYATGRWVVMKGTVEDNPLLEICRSQQDVRILGDWKKLINEVRDSHWVMAYGDHVEAVEYAARKIGITVETL